MKQKYADWIKNWLKNNDPRSACAEATLEMQKAFPELKRFRGYFQDPIWLSSAHWWLKDIDADEIVDPTISQFTYLSDEQYTYYDESLPEPKGKCMNCGKLSYHTEHACSKKCSKILEKEFNATRYMR